MMDIYSVTPQMERHMTSIEFFGSRHSVMHSVEEDEAANKFIESGKGDFNDDFIYDELDEEDDMDLLPEKRSKDEDDEETLLKAAQNDMLKKLGVVTTPKKTIKKETTKIKNIKKVKVETYGSLYGFEF